MDMMAKVSEQAVDLRRYLQVLVGENNVDQCSNHTFRYLIKGTRTANSACGLDQRGFA